MARPALTVLLAMAAAGSCGPSPSKVADSGRPCGPAGASVVQLAYSTDGRWLAAAHTGGTVTVVELATGSAREIGSPGGSPPRVALTEDGGLLAAAADGTVRLWSVANGELVRDLTVGAGEGVSLKFSDAPAPLLLAAFDRATNSGDNLKIWRIADGILVASLSGSAQATFTYADEAVLLIDEARGGFDVVSFGGRLLRRVTFPRALAKTAFAADGAYLGGIVRADMDSERVAIMSVADDGFVWLSPETNRATRQLLFLENPSRLVQLGERTLVYDQADGMVSSTLPALDTASAAVASPDGETIAALTSRGIRLVAAREGTVAALPCPDR